jgi:arylsulfatase A-like enzyme
MLLGDLGYRTALTGMQHEAVDPKSIGFDEVYQLDGGGQFCDPVADLATDWLERQPTDEPFFLTVGFTEVHRDYEVIGPGERREDQPDRAELDRVVVPGFLPDNDHTRLDLAWMNRSVVRADAATGRVVDAVRARPDADNTLIIFTTDHGIPFPRAKSTLYDSGIRISLIMVPPPAWQVAPTVVDQLVSHVDITPTLVELGGGECDVDGVSIAGLLRGESVERRQSLLSMKDLHEIYDPMRTVRTERYKYIRNFHPGPRLILSTDLDLSPTRAGMGVDYRLPRDHEELYDVRADPDELTNLAGDPAHADLLASLRDQLARELADLGDAAFDAWDAVELAP